MKKLLIASAAAALLAGPAAAQPRAADLSRALPSAAEIEAMAPALDRMTGALLDVEVGPLLDAADRYARRPGYGRSGRTLGRLAERDDPYFEQRLRDSIYGTTAEIGRMMDAFAVAAPALERSLIELEAGIRAATDDYRRRRPLPPVEWDDDYYEDEFED
jgi:hypothetical protein